MLEKGVPIFAEEIVERFVPGIELGGTGGVEGDAGT
jgi:hypothetical protein